MKYFKTFIVLVMVIGLPAGSWLFLQQGLEWRKVKRDQLVAKTHLLKDLNWTEEQKNKLTALFAGKTTLLISGAQSQNSESIIDQFKDAYTFQVKEAKNLPSGFKEKLSTKEFRYLVIDTAMVVRQNYADDQIETVNRLVEDLALIAPQRSERDIKVRTKTNE